MTKMTTDLESARAFLAGMSGGAVPTPVLCAVSGGLDSMCLLHLLSTLGRDLTVTAAHFNHRLRGAESDRDEAFVRDWCAAKGIPFVFGGGDVRLLAEEEGLSLEEAARNARYAFLTEQQRLLKCTFILTAHHADDNAETMLLNLLRGTGLRGLTGIPEIRGNIARPFLQVTRAELEQYAKVHHIPHVEDSTNCNPDAAARNLMRLRVMPLLRELNPRAAENMARTAELLRQDEQALELETGILLREGSIEPGVRAKLPVEACDERPRAVVNRAVWSLLCIVGGRQKDLTARHIELVCGLLRGEPGRELSLPYGMTARREAHALVIFRKNVAPEPQPFQVGETVPFGDWTVTLRETGPGRAIFLPSGAALSVTRWDRRDCMTLPGSRGERSLKRLCADWGIPPSRRDAMPVLRVNGTVAAVPGIGVDAAFLPRGTQEVFYVTFHHKKEERHYEK